MDTSHRLLKDYPCRQSPDRIIHQNDRSEFDVDIHHQDDHDDDDDGRSGSATAITISSSSSTTMDNVPPTSMTYVERDTSKEGNDVKSSTFRSKSSGMNNGRRRMMMLSFISASSTLLVLCLGRITVETTTHGHLRSSSTFYTTQEESSLIATLPPPPDDTFWFSNSSRGLQDQDDTSTCSVECCKSFEKEICPNENNWIQSVPSWAQIIIIVILLCFSALFSGLTLGLMSLDITGLEIVMAGDDEKMAGYAKKIYPLRKRGNLLLCTLLLGNVAVNSLLSIFLGEVAGGTIGFVVSTMLITIFGEILPQALCSRYALLIGSATVPIVKVIRLVLFPVAYPLALCLDWMLGREMAVTYSSAEMMELLKIHVKENALDPEAANAMTGALTYQQIPVKEAMTPMERTFMLGVDEKLSFDTIGKIFKTGFSRIPVYEISRNNVIGLLFVKDLIFIDPEDEVPIRSFIQIFGRAVELVWPDDTLGDVLAELKKGRSHLAVVRDVNNEDEAQDPFYEIKGIITLEDIVERILGDAIVDETDAFVDNSHLIKVDRRESFEWARLRLLDTKIVDELLSASEIAAVTAHLKTNYASCFKLITDVQLTRLVSRTPVSTFPTAKQELGQGLPTDLLYEKGKPTDAFTLILSGKITIIVGEDSFRSDLSSWSVLGKSALEQDGWTPDFTAYVSDGPCRCIQISHAVFVEAIDASAQERRMAESKVGTAALSAASSDVDDGHSSVDGRSSEGPVPNRRGVVLAKLFSHSRGESKSNLDSFPIKETTVQFVDDQSSEKDQEGNGECSDNNQDTTNSSRSPPSRDNQEQNGHA